MRYRASFAKLLILVVIVESVAILFVGNIQPQKVTVSKPQADVDRSSCKRHKIGQCLSYYSPTKR